MNTESETNGRNAVTTQQLIAAIKAATKYYYVQEKSYDSYETTTVSYIDADAFLAVVEGFAEAEKMTVPTPPAPPPGRLIREGVSVGRTDEKT